MPFAKRLVEKVGACAIAALLAYFFQSDETLVNNTFALFLVPFVAETNLPETNR